MTRKSKRGLASALDGASGSQPPSTPPIVPPTVDPRFSGVHTHFTDNPDDLESLTTAQIEQQIKDSERRSAALQSLAEAKSIEVAAMRTAREVEDTAQAERARGHAGAGQAGASSGVEEPFRMPPQRDIRPPPRAYARGQDLYLNKPDCLEQMSVTVVRSYPDAQVPGDFRKAMYTLVDENGNRLTSAQAGHRLSPRCMHYKYGWADLDGRRQPILYLDNDSDTAPFYVRSPGS
jgi:hypothetical protein